MQLAEVFVTVGDPSGVGPEIVVAVLGSEESLPEGLALICDRDLLEATARRLGSLSTELQQTADRFRSRLNAEVRLIQPGVQPASNEPGAWHENNVPYIRETLRVGLAAARGQSAALVTGPVDKRFFAALGFQRSGHTEYLAGLTNDEDPVMLLDGGRCRTVVLTRHIPLSEVASRVEPPRLKRGVQLAAQFVRAVEGDDPRPIAVAGLDPHCGEWGASSRTDLEVAGWVRALRDEGLPVEGPYPADTLFLPGRWHKYGVVLCWYHDQGLIPVKLHAFSSAVNVTLGLPVVRVAPAHGTAYDIAGSGRAETGSFSRAIRLAHSLVAGNLTS